MPQSELRFTKEENTKCCGNNSKEGPKGIIRCLLEKQILELIRHQWESGALMERRDELWWYSRKRQQQLQRNGAKGKQGLFQELLIVHVYQEGTRWELRKQGGWRGSSDHIKKGLLYHVLTSYLYGFNKCKQGNGDNKFTHGSRKTSSLK